jgi:hypothetical protein
MLSLLEDYATTDLLLIAALLLMAAATDLSQRGHMHHAFGTICAV